MLTRSILVCILLGFVVASPPVAADNYGLRFHISETDRVTVMRSSTLEPVDITVEAWVKHLGGSGAWGRILRKTDPFTTGYTLAWDRGGSGTVRFTVDYPADGVVDPHLNSIYLGEWHHFAGVYNSSAQLLTLVIDGVAVASEPYSGPLIHTDDLYIGSAIYGPADETFNGIIDEVRVWSVAKTPEEIRSTMFAQLTGTEPGLIAYWPFNEGSGQIAHDQTANGNHGQLGTSPEPDLLDPEWTFIDGWVPVEQLSWGRIKATFH